MEIKNPINSIDPLDLIASPVYEKLGAGSDMETEVQKQMAEDQGDPRKQMYFLRLDCKRIVKSEAEYKRLVKEQIPIRMVSYNVAMDLERAADARAKAAKVARKKRKAASAARRSA